MKIDILQRKALGPGRIFEAYMVKIHRAVSDLQNWLCRIRQGGLLLQHLTDALG